MTVTHAPTDVPKVKVRNPGDLIAAVPYLLGFHPTDSVVILAVQDRQIVFAARHDLPDRGERAGSLARHLLDVVARQGVGQVAVICYGAAVAADPVAGAVRSAAARRGLRVLDVLRVDAGRWWSYTCDDPACCPADGTLIDTAASEVSAACSFAGLAPAKSREELAGQVAPIGGLTRIAMTQATDRAGDRFLAQFGSLPDDGERGAALLTEGEGAVRAAIERYAEGGVLDDDEAAWLTVLLLSIPVRDRAWRAIDAEEPHLRLWRDVTRRADPELAPAPASLLAFTAWRFGDGALAGLALERALREDPSYSMAQLLRHGLQQGLPPAVFDDWGTAAWDERTAGEQRRPGRRRGSDRRHPNRR